MTNLLHGVQHNIIALTLSSAPYLGRFAVCRGMVRRINPDWLLAGTARGARRHR